MNDTQWMAIYILCFFFGMLITNYLMSRPLKRKRKDEKA